MPASQNAVDLIKEFEGFSREAYLDPVDIPTIGFGTIRYPDGKKVAMGDRVTTSEAEAFLKFECDQVSNALIEETKGLALNQNQFDALVSFCYNLGVGALHESTLLKRLQAGDKAGAATEFLKWNKAIVNGVKQELPGLTRRRAREKALFEAASSTPASGPAEVSPRESVIAIKGFRSGNDNVIAASDAQGRVVEVLQLDGDTPEAFRALLGIYPKLKSVSIAGPGEQAPQGARVKLNGRASTLSPVASPPKLHRKLLALGSEDGPNVEGDDVKQLQLRLKDLGYFDHFASGVFERTTDEAVRKFQADYFGVSEADGRVGPVTWSKLWGEVKPVTPGGPATPVGAAPAAGVATGAGAAPSPGKNYLKLVKTNELFSYGCTKLLLTYFKDGKPFAPPLEVCSGQARKQIFRKGAQSPTGSMEPLPEGLWSIGDIEWAAGKDKYSGGVFNSGLGPVKIRLEYKGPGTTPRQAIEIHIDWNRDEAPGTAGCVGLQNIADFKVLAGWLRDTDPRSLYVDWGLGTCPAP